MSPAGDNEVTVLRIWRLQHKQIFCSELVKGRFLIEIIFRLN
jgi:hypothetical protein